MRTLVFDDDQTCILVPLIRLSEVVDEGLLCAEPVPKRSARFEICDIPVRWTRALCHVALLLGNYCCSGDKEPMDRTLAGTMEVDLN